MRCHRQPCRFVLVDAIVEPSCVRVVSLVRQTLEMFRLETAYGIMSSEVITELRIRVVPNAGNNRM